jgi:hypothetical protein
MMKKKQQVTQAVEGIANMYQTLAVVGVLAERHLIEPDKVADWISKFLSEIGTSDELPPQIKSGVAARLEVFLTTLNINFEKPAHADID